MWRSCQCAQGTEILFSDSWVSWLAFATLQKSPSSGFLVSLFFTCSACPTCDDLSRLRQRTSEAEKRTRLSWFAMHTCFNFMLDLFCSLSPPTPLKKNFYLSPQAFSFTVLLPTPPRPVSSFLFPLHFFHIPLFLSLLSVVISQRSPWPCR